MPRVIGRLSLTLLTPVHHVKVLPGKNVGVHMAFISSEAAAAKQHEIAIIGSGPAGISLALELERLGVSSIILESGLVCGSVKHQELAAAASIDPNRHDDMRIATARRLGGTSNLWGGRCLPMDPIDFAGSEAFRSAEWPIRLSDLEPHFASAAEYLDCGAPIFCEPTSITSTTNTSFHLDRLERYSNGAAIQVKYRRRLEASKLISICLDATVLSGKFEGESVVSVTASGLGGRRFDITAQTFVVACGGVESTRLLLILQRSKPGLAGGQNGALGKYYMGHLIGVVADIEIHDSELDRLLDFYIDGNGSYVRRRIVPSDSLLIAERLLNVAFWPVIPPVSDARHRDPILSSAFLALSLPFIGRLMIAEAIRKRHVPDGAPLLPHVQNVLANLPSVLWYSLHFLWKRYCTSRRLPGFFRRNSARRYGLSYHAEQSPLMRSCISLSQILDSVGMPRVDIDLQFDRRDAENLMRTHGLLDQWLQAKGLGRLIYREPQDQVTDAIIAQAAHGTHQIGTARMGRTPAEGAVDPCLRVFGSDNLYLCSSAVFPTSGQCNPTFLIVSLACRLATHLSSAGLQNSSQFAHVSPV